ncbi:unnamed protein product [Caenorhabditis auriculariae]|uniref:Uncharacterized protein n=1 Tax=Caenorhabditis auriculariae TaxID=2777116 RepID=A0A8S1GRX3_9PELO|nr:unnamed protein product [Caenorhabditis auriculariae]
MQASFLWIHLLSLAFLVAESISMPLFDALMYEPKIFGFDSVHHHKHHGHHKTKYLTKQDGGASHRAQIYKNLLKTKPIWPWP